MEEVTKKVTMQGLNKPVPAGVCNPATSHISSIFSDREQNSSTDVGALASVVEDTATNSKQIDKEISE